MERRAGTFIVIEGTDGSGKGTQAELLRDRLRQAGYDVATFDFPQYDLPSSYFVKQYLNGEYGSAEDVGPYTASLFYALDRYEAAPKIREALAQGKVVISNRFTGSNMGHQGTKFNNPEERRGYFIWLDNLEFEMLRIPRPDISFVLRVPAEIAQQLVDQKAARAYTAKKRDLHEADLAHLQRALEVYDDMTQLFPKDFQRIDCVRGDKLLDVDTIQSMLWEKISPLLPPPPQLEMPMKTAPAPSVSEPASGTEPQDLPELQPTPASEELAGGPDTAGPPEQQPTAVPDPEPQPSANPNEPYAAKDATGIWGITPRGYDFLKEVVTDPQGDVYAFGDKLAPVTIAAAMARLSRRGDDMRITILDEFASAAGKDAKLLQRVITAYGDDSVQQLVGQHVVVENASNLLTKKLEWGRLASYLEQSTRYIYYDKKDKGGSYKYFTPTNFDATTTQQYRAHMDRIFDFYSGMVHTLAEYIGANDSTPKEKRDAAWKSAVRAQACDAIRPVLPTATKSTVGIFASGQALESLIMHLLGDELPEARKTGESLLREARKVLPAFLERADKPDRGGAATAYRANTRAAVKKLAHQYLPAGYGSVTTPVELTDFWPRNEIELVPDMLYEYSNLPLANIREAVISWPYNRKLDVFEAYMGERLNRRHRPGRALEKAHYSWDLMCDYGIFRDLQRHRMVDDLEWQELTPRYGYDVPKLVEDAGLTEPFQECFDLSLHLYSLLQQGGYASEAQYATLLGHKMRWKMTFNAREAFHFCELRTSPQGHPGYRKLAKQMHEKIAGVHPLLAESMQFVNQGEDPALSRLAAERYTQFKLQQLDGQG